MSEHATDGAGPHGGEEREPDYRFTLANERTFLAWVRTALALLAGGVAVDQLVEAASPWRDVVAVACVVVSALTVLSGYRRWSEVTWAMRRDLPLPPPRAVPRLALGLSVVGGAVVLLVARG